jgi:hypothetical protein
MSYMPAFPQPDVLQAGSTLEQGHAGMTLRDYFAAKAMQAYLTNPAYDGIDEESVAQWSYNMADDMLKARQA